MPAVTTWSPDTLRTALLQTESLFYCNLNSISKFQAVLERLLPQAGMFTVMENTLSDASVFLGNWLLSHLLQSQRRGTQGFRGNVTLQKWCKCLCQVHRATLLAACGSAGALALEQRQWSVVCMQLFLLPPRTSWKSWSWWCVARSSRWPAYKTVSCSRVSLWLPQAQVWASGQCTHTQQHRHMSRPLRGLGPLTQMCAGSGVAPETASVQIRLLGKTQAKESFRYSFIFLTQNLDQPAASVPLFC